MKPIQFFKDKVLRLSNEFMELKTDENISIKDRIDYKDKTLIVNFSIINRPKEWTRGVFNGTSDSRFVCFLDYDYTKINYIKGELKLLQEVYDLGDIHIFKSSEKGYHAISFVKLFAKEYVEILTNSSCDQAFKNTPRFVSYRNWVLRNFGKGKQPKPLYIKTLKGKTNREQSYAHWKYFNLLYPNKINKLTNSDGLEKLRIVDYPTGTNI